ncbi:MAG TPA: hypothetical protein VKX39_11165 [Bryobacteraceae bacterium]|jgi:hypothetical protein|nr:hypothetical protein [Bryobacteraceae bacterium]
MRMYYISRIAGAASVAGLAAASIFAIERARADFAFRSNSPDAVRLAPGNTEYLMFRALQIEYDGGDPRPLWERAAELNPLNSAPRIALGLNAEVRGDFASAEKWLLEAARADHQFEPRWTLANFYFRRENSGQFWKWMRAALEVSYGDRRPAFELCWRMSGQPEQILARAIPERPEVLAAYLGWLLETGRPRAIAPVAMKIASIPGDRPLLLAADDALLAAGDGANALSLWRAMGFAAPAGVFRGNFEPGAIGHGFDWRLNALSGVTHTDIDAPRAMHRIDFDGREPESCELLGQMLLLEKGRRYRLRWNASITGIASPGGFEWRVGEARAAASGGAGELEFIAPAEIADLKLLYQRPPGHARADGRLELWEVHLEPRI